jgi:hypothetical protein
VGRTVVCISATDGAAAEEIAPLVAAELGFQLVDEQVVARAAREAGVEDEVVADVEQRPSLIGRVLDQLRMNPSSASPLAGYAAIGVTDPTPPADSLRGLIQSAIEEIASRGQAVIVSHAASLALTERPDTLRVLITASPEVRRDRIKAAREVTENEAEKLMARGDANRADYIKRFYGVPEELPTHYDVVVNTDRLTPEQATDIVLHAARSEVRPGTRDPAD